MLGDDVGYVDTGGVEGVVGIKRVSVAVFFESGTAGARGKAVVPMG